MNEWVGMPEFIQEKKKPYKHSIIRIADRKLNIRFENKSDYELFIKGGASCSNNVFYFETKEDLALYSNQKITEKTKSLWFPYKSHWGGITKKYIGKPNIKNRYPVYIVSKGRSKNGLTTKALDIMGINHFIVVEDHEVEEYKTETNANVISLPSTYLEDYEVCDDLGLTKSKGPGAARNFCIDHSKQAGFDRHWVMDDNLDAFHYLNKNEKYEVECGSILAASEDFIDRYENIPVSGFNYYSFCKKDEKVPPFVMNTRIYSCLLIDNHSGYRWRGRYNEDTDLSLRVLKDGLCTVQFNVFLCGKVTTQRMKGGNSKEFYNKEGTLPKSKMIANLHPDVAKVVWKFNRWHHQVNYKPFAGNKLIKKQNIKMTPKVDNYGLVLVPKERFDFKQVSFI